MPQQIAFVGRFQPLHKGHVHAIRTLMQESDVTLVIGSAQKERTKENPLSFEERKRVLENCFDLPVVGVEDVHDDEAWARAVNEHGPFDLAVSGNAWTRRCFEKIDIDTREPEILDPDIYSGTRIREQIQNGEAWKELVPECAHAALEDVNFERIVRQAIRQ